MRASRLVLVLVLVALGAAGCAPTALAPPTGIARLTEGARAAGLTLADPMALDDETLNEVRHAIGGRGEAIDRLRHLDDWLRHARGELEYAPDEHLDAQQAYDQRRADCMAYALLFSSLAGKSLGIPTTLLHATEIVTHQERRGWFYVSSHVAVGHGTGPNAVVFDFSAGRLTNWHLSPYEPIDDATAAALHYNNVAVGFMAAGRMTQAERLLTVLADVASDAPEPTNNLAVARNRLGQHSDALRLLQGALARFPAYPPLYTNAIHAATAAGLPDLARQLEARGREVADRDPFFLFARGLRLYETKSYTLAARQFERASAAEPASPVLQAWLARAYLSAGDADRGREAYDRARELGPRASVVRDLERQFPELVHAR